VTAVVDGKPVTLAATEAFVVELDCFQYEIGEGPCIDAVRVGRTVRAEFLTDGARYPIFGPRALTVDVVGTLSEPLESEGTVLGSINLFGRTSDALDGGTLRPARLLATQASAAVAAAVVRDDLRRKVAQLEQALESRDVIAQAKGILMLQSGVGPDEAFSLLVKASQRENRKLRDIAQEIADRTRQGGSGGRRSGGTG
jgi:GAF domain-containing protein